ncbi:MAG: trypsin-like peptidase domain-containing protein [Acidobacteriota bacterium]
MPYRKAPAENHFEALHALLGILLLGILLLGPLSSAAYADNPLVALNDGVVKIHSHMYEQADETGAGIVVRLDSNIVYILTAFHVVEDAEKIEVEFHSDPVRRYEAQVHRFDEALDIAVIYIDDERVPRDLPPLQVGLTAALQEAAEVTAMGHQPGDLDWQLSTETITNENDPYDPRKLLFTKIAIDRGNSGGPLFMDDRLIGIVISKAPTLAVAVKIDYAITYLEQWRVPPSQLIRTTFEADPIVGDSNEDPSSGASDGHLVEKDPQAEESGEELDSRGGVLLFQTTPATAQIFLDDKRVGVTRAGSLTLENITPGPRKVRVSQRGYNPWQDTVEVKENREVMISVHLQREASGSSASQAGIESDCFDRVQGKIAWNNQGNTAWSPNNVERLCKGTSNASQPPSCFNRAMHGDINPGSGGRWTWSTAIDLCEGTSNARTTLSCFENRIRRGDTQQAAIKACTQPTALAPNPVVSVPIATVLFPQTGVEADCFKRTQGKIAWDYKGSKTWAENNIKRLCKGTTRASEPPRCFDRAMHGGIEMGSGTRWTWSTALDLCEGSNDASRTLACFEGRIRRGNNQTAAIKACSR